MTLINQIKDFYQYCNDFYNEEYGVYKIASERDINFAVDKYIKSKKAFDIEFDSIDREQVRLIIGK